MATKAHSLVSLAARHPIIKYQYADAATRAAASGFTANDLYTVAHQQDNDTFWLLLATTPTWSQLVSAPGGDMTIAGDLILSGGGSITSDGNGDVIIVAQGTGVNQIGTAGSTSQGMGANDLFCSADAEFDGRVYFDSDIRIANGRDIELGDSGDVRIQYASAQTPDSLVIGLSAQSNGVIFCEDADRTFDFAHPQQTNPTIFVHSANQSTTEWIGITHDQTDGLLTTGAGNLKILPAGITQIGDASSTSHSLAANDDLFVSGILEVDGVAYFDNDVIILGTKDINLQDNSLLKFGTSNDVVLEFDTGQTVDSLLLALNAASRGLVIIEEGDRGYDFAHSQQTNPTIFVHSANQSTTEWIGITHDQTDGLLTTGAGNLKILPAGITQIGDASSTSHSLAANDDLFVSGILEVDGVFYADGASTFSSDVTLIDARSLAFGTAKDAEFRWNTAQTNDGLFFGTGNTSNYILIGQTADISYDYQVANQTNPSLFIFSANQSTTEWRSQAHNQTDAIDGIGSGSKVTEHEVPTELADDASFDLPDASAGFGTLVVEDSEEYTQFYWKTDGTVTLVNNTANVVAADTDTKFCLFDNGTAVRVRNRLGAAKSVMFDYHFTTSP